MNILGKHTHTRARALAEKLKNGDVKSTKQNKITIIAIANYENENKRLNYGCLCMWCVVCGVARVRRSLFIVN